MLKILNTLSRKKESFRPRLAKRVDIFVCGPTVYDYSHIGHARTYTVFDVIARYLKHQGYKVRYLQNITDIDDKIINRARERRLDPAKLAQDHAAFFLEDMKRLGIETVWKYAPASAHIPAVITQITGLMKKGFAYPTPNGVYFSVPRFKDYGKLSHRKLDEMREAVRIEPDPYKQHPADFALWKAAKPGEPSWDSPWGKGRPGWHIEDTAISEKYFGAQYDLHGGALDLIFPHHESEIAQMEAFSGKKPLVKYWLHTGFLNVRGEKMAKSLGNFIMIRELLSHHRPEAFRILMLQTHYRSPVDYDESLIRQAEISLERLVECKERLAAAKSKSGASAKKIAEAILSAKKKFIAAMDNDFDTPRALATVFELVREVNPLLDRDALSAADKKLLAGFFKEVDSIFGIFPKQEATPTLPEEIQRLITKREQLRKERRFFEADGVRRQLIAHGWNLEDTPQGPRVKRITTH